MAKFSTFLCGGVPSLRATDTAAAQIFHYRSSGIITEYNDCSSGRKKSLQQQQQQHTMLVHTRKELL